MKQLRILWRLIFLAFYTTWIVARIMLVTAIYGFSPKKSMTIRRGWAKNLLKGIGVKIVQDGPIPNQPCLLMCNHRSYLDPIIMMADILAYPVAKAEVEKWPVLGYGAKVSGILYLKRESAASRKRTMVAIADTIKSGWPVILFPEGTTYDTPVMGPLKRGGFQLAVNEGLTIVPVALDFGETADYWIGDDTFIAHFFRRFGNKHIYVRIRYGSPLVGEDAQTMQEEAANWINSQLAEFQTETGWRAA